MKYNVCKRKVTSCATQARGFSFRRCCCSVCTISSYDIRTQLQRHSNSISIHQFTSAHSHSHTFDVWRVSLFYRLSGRKKLYTPSNRTPNQNEIWVFLKVLVVRTHSENTFFLFSWMPLARVEHWMQNRPEWFINEYEYLQIAFVHCFCSTQIALIWRTGERISSVSLLFRCVCFLYRKYIYPGFIFSNIRVMTTHWIATKLESTDCLHVLKIICFIGRMSNSGKFAHGSVIAVCHFCNEAEKIIAYLSNSLKFFDQINKIIVSIFFHSKWHI